MCDDYSRNERRAIHASYIAHGTMGQFSENGKVWIEFVRVISSGRDPKITPERIRRLTELLDAG